MVVLTQIFTDLVVVLAQIFTDLGGFPHSVMYYVDFCSLFSNPENDPKILLGKASDAPPEPSLFD